MKSQHPKTDEAIAEGIVCGGEFGMEHRPLVDLARRMEIALREIARADRMASTQALAAIAYGQVCEIARDVLNAELAHAEPS